MNKQRKVLITITYNEMGIIIDTKAEELGSFVQPEKHTDKRTETHGVCLDAISRQAAQRLFGKALTYKERNGKLTWTTSEVKQWIADCIEQLPPAQPEIIYCGDCKYKDDGIDEDGIPFLKCLHGRSYGGTRINDFCSLAERRTDGQI